MITNYKTNSNNQCCYISGSISFNPNAVQDFNDAEQQMKQRGFVNIFNPVAQDKILGFKAEECMPGKKDRASVLKNDCI